MKVSTLRMVFRRLILVSATIVIIFFVIIFRQSGSFAIDRTVNRIGNSEDRGYFHQTTSFKNVREFLSNKMAYKARIDISSASRVVNVTLDKKSSPKLLTSEMKKGANVSDYVAISLKDTNGYVSLESSMKQQQRDDTNSSQGAHVLINGLLQQTSSSLLEINCTKLFLGDVSETLKANTLVKTKPHKQTEPAKYISATKNCETFSLVRGYVKTVSDEERDFPLAYSILVHKNVEQFERLLRAIYRTNNYYCIHVDKKVTKVVFDAIKSIVDCFPNVFIASKLEVVVYAGYTRLKADINCMEELYNNFSDWKYVLNMAGSEFPLKANIEMVQLLKLYNGSNLVGKNMKSLNPGRWKNRFETVVNGLSGYIVKRNSSNIPAPFNLTLTKGSAYLILSRDMVRYVLNDPVPQAFLEWCKSTFSPDEHFWATLNNLEHNPHLMTPGGNRCKAPSYMERAVMWYSPKCRGKLVRSVCVFGAADLPWIEKRVEFIINKFDIGIDYVSYHCIEQLQQQRQRNTVPWDLAQHTAYLETHSHDKCGILKNV